MLSVFQLKKKTKNNELAWWSWQHQSALAKRTKESLAWPASQFELTGKCQTSERRSQNNGNKNQQSGWHPSFPLVLHARSHVSVTPRTCLRGPESMRSPSMHVCPMYQPPCGCTFISSFTFFCLFCCTHQHITRTHLCFAPFFCLKILNMHFQIQQQCGARSRAAYFPER